MLVIPDLSQVKDTVGPGTYNVRIVDADIDEWPARNNKPATPYINWRMETFNEADEKNNGRSVFWRTPTAGGGAFQVKNLYRAAIGSELKGDFDTDELLSKEVQVTIVEGQNGYTDIKSVRALM